MEEGEHVDQEWLKTPEGREWLESDEGRAWLDTHEGNGWVATPDGWVWLNSSPGERWQRESNERGWDAYFAGRNPEPPPFAMGPETAPHVGTRVRFKRDCETANGRTRFTEGELAVIAEARFLPSRGMVSVTLQTLDGWTLVTTMASTFVRATS